MNTINGLTLKDITRLMIKTEKLINWYNKKYNFQMGNASEKEIREYEGAIKTWDFLKAKRDLLNNN